MNLETALGIIRLMMSGGVMMAEAIENEVIPTELREQIREVLEKESNIILEPARMLISREERLEWLNSLDRSEWYYWQTLRNYLLGPKNWPEATVRSLDETTDRILQQLSPPSMERFDLRGLVIGYVQSGKTANYTALIAKAADVGYRLVIVLSGMDNSLRRQTQIRLNQELVGYTSNHGDAVPLPPMGKQWHSFTTEDINGDFRAGNANYAALQATQPVLLVVKKNGPVLRRLHAWLDSAPEDVHRELPILVIDDEADQASVDTQGSYQLEDDEPPEEYETPSVINSLIRELLGKFQKTAYVAYTATPFANILIPHDTFDPEFKNDLYPKDFIVDLPKPPDYLGAEELFGRFNPTTGEEIEGLDVVRIIPDSEFDDLKQDIFPYSLEMALLDFVLSGAARMQRGQGDQPSTMLLHGSHLILKQQELTKLVERRYSEIRDEWRYQRNHRIAEQLRNRWNDEFVPVINSVEPSRVVDFHTVEPYIGPFFEAVEVREINSRTGDVLDYQRDPGLKAIAIGGNRLSRGLTLEGLLISYFFRASKTYDTLMQMGRWFGFRNEYKDLTRIYMPENISGWFSDLALVEYELRQDIRIYEMENVTPLELGARIVKHPAMLVTSRLKQRYARPLTIEQSYSNQVLQTIRFPFHQPDVLQTLLEHNFKTTVEFLSGIGGPSWEGTGPVWHGVAASDILAFFQKYDVDEAVVRNISLPLLIAYIEKQNEIGELTDWTVAVRQRTTIDETLGEIDLGLGKHIPMLSRTRLASDPDSLGVITSPGDEQIGLGDEELKKLDDVRSQSGNSLGVNPASRLARKPTNGLLLIYPISKFSGHENSRRRSRRPIYEHPNKANARDVICLAVSFPKSPNPQVIVGKYVQGTVDWRPIASH